MGRSDSADMGHPQRLSGLLAPGTGHPSDWTSLTPGAAEPSQRPPGSGITRSFSLEFQMKEMGMDLPFGKTGGETGGSSPAAEPRGGGAASEAAGDPGEPSPEQPSRGHLRPPRCPLLPAWGAECRRVTSPDSTWLASRCPPPRTGTPSKGAGGQRLARPVCGPPRAPSLWGRLGQLRPSPAGGALST